MKREEVVQQSESALAELVDLLKAGKSEKLIEYLTMLSRFHRYSFGNCMLIAAQNPEATLVAGFGHWKKLGRFVKKGERGIAILAPLIGKAKEKEESAKQDAADSDRRIFGFRVVHVFDVAQTEGEELPSCIEELSGDPGENLEHLESIVRAKSIDLVYEAIPGGAQGVSSGGRITVLPDLPAAEKFSVLAHELGHELLHRGDRREKTDKTIRETEAEAVAFVVSRSVGIDSRSRSSDYIQLWNGDEKTLMESLELIRSVASSIIGEMEQLRSQSLEAVAVA